jgi:hypothetical protein
VGRRSGKLLRAVFAAAVIAGCLAGCSPAPTSTIVTDSGVEKTISWADYPGHAGTEADEVLAAPTPEETERRAQAIMGEIEAVLSRDHGLHWSTDGDPADWYPQNGNGYGGESYLVTYNSESRVSDGVPDGPNAWREVLADIDGILAGHGMDPMVLEHESSPYLDDAQWQEELREKFGTTDPDAYWEWTAASYSGSQWLHVTLTDTSKDATGRAADEAREFGWPLRAISISFGATTVAAEQREEFRRALEPFQGLDKPEPTTSD